MLQEICKGILTWELH